MTEKLFRIWNEKDRKYIFFSLEKPFNLKEMITLDSLLNKGYKLELFSGLKDKAGVKIFENDIVKTTNGEIQLISFDIVNYNDELVPLSGALDANKISDLLSKSDQVIGNIHENSDLLKENKKVNDVFETVEKKLEKEIQDQIKESNKKLFSEKIIWKLILKGIQVETIKFHRESSKKLYMKTTTSKAMSCF